MKRNLLLFAVSLILVIGFTTSASASSHPWTWQDITDTDDHTWGGEQGWGSGGPVEAFGPVTGIIALDVLIIRLICVITFDDKDHGIIKAQIDTGRQGGDSQNWPQEHPICSQRGE